LRRPQSRSRRSGFDQLAGRLASLRREHPDRVVELWCEDEARLGLKPVARRVWALKGTRPTSNGRHKFESVFVYGFAHPGSGRSRFLMMPTANTEQMGRAMAEFASWAELEGPKVLVLLVERAGWHVV